MGHALAAWRMSGNTDLIVLGPIGGMHWPNVPREPHREVIVALAGVIANFIVMSLMVPRAIASGSKHRRHIGSSILPTSKFSPARLAGLSRPKWLLDELAAVVGQFNSRRSVGWRSSAAQRAVATMVTAVPFAPWLAVE